ncbi:MAG: low molecular weight protein-tyrosine-phosphatase [Mariprofundaceae bacterium]|nr:low molecular weight protein-tyrosine-phosphatase [Mariprofundaceae bacterium]
MPDAVKPNPTRILFVCLGNICRSPLAEAIVRERALVRRLDRQFCFASAGTGDWHVGSGADVRSAATARAHGTDLSAHRARQITPSGTSHWHWFVAMDKNNKKDLLAMGVNSACVLMMRQFEPENHEPPDVPDPYYGGEDGFENIYRLLEANADPLLDYLIANA